MSQPKQPALGRPKTIGSAIEEFPDRTRNASREEASALWEGEWELFADKPLSTRYAYVTRYRNALRDALGADHLALAVVRVLDKTKESSAPLSTRSTRGYGGRKPVRSERIAQFAAEVIADFDAAKTATSRRVKDKAREKACAKLAQAWKMEIKSLVDSYTPNTVLTYVSQYRKVMLDAGLEQDLIALVAAPTEMVKAVTTTYRNRIIDRHHDLVAMPNWRQMVEIAVDTLPNPKGAFAGADKEARAVARKITRDLATEIGVALALLTGRRLFEIFCQGTLAPAYLDYPGAHGRIIDSWHVRFSGQAKTRAKPGTQFDEVFTIPVLAKAPLILFAWSIIRHSAPGQVWIQMNNTEFKNDLLRPVATSLLNAKRDEMFSKLWPSYAEGDSLEIADAKKLKSNNIRALYAEIADNMFRPKSKTKAAFFQEILGHTEKDIETASSYMKYYLPDQKTAGPTKQVRKRLGVAIEQAAQQREKERAHEEIGDDDN